MIQDTITTGKGKFAFVELPFDVVNIFENMGYLVFQSPNYDTWIKDKDLWNYEKCMKHLENNKNKDEWVKRLIKLPEGNYKFIAVLKSFVIDWHEASQNLTEKTAAQIVDDNGMGCWDNYRMKKDEKYTCKNAMDSFSCLILNTKHSLKVDANYAILKII